MDLLLCDTYRKTSRNEELYGSTITQGGQIVLKRLISKESIRRIKRIGGLDENSGETNRNLKAIF